MGAVKPPIPGTMHLTTQTSTHTLVYSETIRERDALESRRNEHLEWIIAYAGRQIKRFSHCGDKTAILGYIVEWLDVSWPSALDIPLSVHRLISRGIPNSSPLLVDEKNKDVNCHV
jgi:hypothetical protein